MDILLVTVVFPYPVNDGGRSGTFKLIEYLRKEHNITLICPSCTAANHQKLQELWPNVKIQTFNSPKSITEGFNLKGFIKKTIVGQKKPSKSEIFKSNMVLNTTDLVKYYFSNLIQLVQNELNKNSYDLIQVDFIELAPLVHFLPKNIKKVFVHHELRYKRMALEYATLGYKDVGEEWKIANTKLLEVGLMDAYDKVICLTEIDKKTLELDGVTPEKLEVSPLPVDVAEHPINQPFEFNKRLVFLGPEVHFPNLDGVDWFLANCWEKLLSNDPQLKLSILGKWSEEAKKMFAYSRNVTFEGFVEDLSTVMKGSIMIVPLRIGSGMRMKILEGAAWHVPMVSTSIGAEGLPMNHMENCILADTAQDFVDGILALSADASLQNKFVKNAKIIIKLGYSVEECGQVRNEIYKRLIS
ncbi:glycosyltransferase [Lacihabitans sp. CCS-44]|uniref:glycosyltransferase family 4 protein n=1 Tax=Lacihabitans sp. CCS-44 TaxID=2487331 RepID=UPI0020CE7603|nr:glycosyltransferase family 4 protein [Lacihabitans sp. CCS-44]MCP9753751.1 glycosyltransferase [Lacihabitans sp. CCS-44]